jgi:hypothetical protein
MAQLTLSQEEAARGIVAATPLRLIPLDTLAGTWSPHQDSCSTCCLLTSALFWHLPELHIATTDLFFKGGETASQWKGI